MKPVFVLTEADVLQIAGQKFGVDRLTEEQMHQVKKGIEFGLECWEEVVTAALQEVLDRRPSA
jgi:hypothetical protein